MRNIEARASAFFNQDFFYIRTMSRGMLSYTEPNAPPHYLPPDVDDATLGQTLRLALKSSKQVSVEEFHGILNSGVIDRLEKDRQAWVMKEYGYKNKRAMYRNMENCSIDMVEGHIEIQPMHHKSLDGYSATTEDPQLVSVPITAAEVEIGAALREGFRWCTSSVK